MIRTSHPYGLLVALALGCRVALAAAVTVVYPTGEYPEDVNNVQAAVAAGGTVLLKAVNQAGEPTSFNFLLRSESTPGPAPSGVNLDVDVRLIGESSGRHTTTILGGIAPLRGSQSVRRHIEGIRFDRPADDAMLFTASSDLEIVRNRIENVITRQFSANPADSQTDGIDIYNRVSGLTSITGRIRIADNVISIPAGPYINGVQLDTVGADVVIEGNRFDLASPDHGCEVFCGGVQAGLVGGRVDIRHNFVAIAEGAPNDVATGVAVGGFSSARFVVSENDITFRCAFCDGIEIQGNASFGEAVTHASVRNNVLRSIGPQAGSQAAMASFFGDVSDSSMNDNTFIGNAAVGMQSEWLNDPTTEFETNNVMRGNDFRRLSSSMSDVYLDTTSVHTTGLNECATVTDLGTDDHVVCKRSQ